MSRPNSGPRLSLCMIVKNESDHLAGCMDSVQGVVDQIVVVDTGSTDDTTSIASSYGAEVFNFDWVDDFARARNFSLDQARGEWVLWLDADERLTAASRREITRLLRPEARPVIYRVRIRNRMRSGGYEYLSTAHRLFNNHRGIRFSGRIHEQVSPSAAARQGEERESGIIIEHLGYGFSEEQMAGKFRRNGRLLERLVRDEPHNAYAHYTLAQNYGLLEQLDRAAEHYRIARELGQLDSALTATLLNSLGDIYRRQGNWAAAGDCARESIKLFPAQVAGYFLLHKVAAESGDRAESISNLEIMLHHCTSESADGPRLTNDIMIDPVRIRFTLGSEYLLAGRLDQACDCFELVRQARPDDRAVLEELLEIARQKNDLKAMERWLVRLLELAPGDIGLTELLGLVFTKKKDFRAAIRIYSDLLERIPDAAGVVKRLAGLYGLVGETEKSIQLLARLNGGQAGSPAETA
ncbi:MAG: glycosyltransferase [Candidatus Neomarinimicrobiota bacterium]